MDISYGGFRLLSRSQVEPGTIYHLAINLSEDYTPQKTFTIKALSCWSATDVNPDYFAIGFCFIDLSLENFRLIKMLMQRYELHSTALGFQ